MNDPRIEYLKQSIRDIPDFPKPGIVFKDITPLLRDARAFQSALDLLAEALREERPSAIVGIESRGFIFGAPLASALGIGFVPVRKPGKLPAKTRSVTYSLEYGEDTLEIHEDALGREDRVFLVDDLLATGGTMEATCRLVEGLGAVVLGCCFVVELGFLGGREKLAGRPLTSLISYG